MQSIRAKNKSICSILAVFLIITFISGCGLYFSENNVNPLIDNSTRSFVELIKQNKSDIFNVSFVKYKTDLRAYPIGVFDSGIGGLTVLKESF